MQKKVSPKQHCAACTQQYYDNCNRHIQQSFDGLSIIFKKCLYKKQQVNPLFFISNTGRTRMSFSKFHSRCLIYLIVAYIKQQIRFQNRLVLLFKFCKYLLIKHNVCTQIFSNLRKKGRNWDFFENLRNNQLIMHQK